MNEEQPKAMVIKRDGSKEEFNPTKIEKAIIRAMKNSGITKTKLAALIASDSLDKFGKKSEVKIKDIENFIFKELNEYGQSLAANAYERYRATKEYQKKKNDIDDSISGLVGGTNDEVLYENSNKDSFTFSTQRDLIAGECSKAWASKNILPTDVLMAHEQGIIHYHDLDYAIHRGMFNCMKSNMNITFKLSSDDLEITTSLEEFDKRYLKLQMPSTIDGVLVELDQDILIKDKDSWTKILKVQKRIPGSEEFLYRIKTAGGNELEVTGDHIIPVKIPDQTEENRGKIQEIPASEIKVGNWAITGDNLMELIVRIDKYSPDGTFMVYDLETESHHFTCNGIWVHNCFSKDTEFLTTSGNRKFSELKDGEQIYVPTHTGKVQRAIVRNYGKQDLYTYTFQRGGLLEKKVNCTENHRWILKDGKETTNLKPGDIIYSKTQSAFEEELDRLCCKTDQNWKVIGKEFYKSNEEVWCLEVEEDHSFILEGDLVTGNCQLINLKDMLDNGTVINKRLITGINSFSTACTVATQISLQCASHQYGGQTWSCSHLAPYVRKSRERWIKTLQEENEKENLGMTEEQIKAQAETLLKKEIKDGCQTIQYQINTFSSTNGQAPFLSIFMYVNEDPEYSEETAMIIEEMLKQRYKGMQNESGAFITPSFPKLLYVLDEDNVYPGTKYRYLTELAEKTVAKRMMPDFISAKIMKEMYDGEVFPCMGCVDGEDVVRYEYKGEEYCEGIEKMWNRVSLDIQTKLQQTPGCFYIDSDPNVLKIYDTSMGEYVGVRRLVSNKDMSNWIRVKTESGRSLLCTSDHPFPVKDKGRTQAKDLKIGDILSISSYFGEHGNYTLDSDFSWILGAYYLSGSKLKNGKVEFNIPDYDGSGSVVTTLGRVISQVFESGYKSGDNKNKITVSSIEASEKILSVPLSKIVASADEMTKLSVLRGMINSQGRARILSGEKTILHCPSREIMIQTMYLLESLGFRPEIIDKNKMISFDYGQRFNESRDSEEKIVYVEELGYRDRKSYDVTTMSDRFDVSGINSHNCRSFLQPYKDPETGKYKWYGRFNQGVVSLNLPDIALSSKGDMDVFWEILEERLELCKKALMIRHNELEDHDSSRGSEIHWKYGAVSRLENEEGFKKLLYNDYSSISLGYIGLYECTLYMIGKSHTTPEGKEFALKVMKILREHTDKWKEETNIGFSLYGTPSEGLCDSALKKTKKRFGVIPGVTDKEWFTNSYHVSVEEDISAFEKLDFESEFQRISSGGSVSYVEIPDLTNNLEVVDEIVKHGYETCRYFELNGRSGDHCGNCGFDGEIILNDNNEWECPVCHCQDVDLLSVTRRTCGYLGEHLWNQGKTAELKNRVLHI